MKILPEVLNVNAEQGLWQRELNQPTSHQLLNQNSLALAQQQIDIDEAKLFKIANMIHYKEGNQMKLYPIWKTDLQQLLKTGQIGVGVYLYFDFLKYLCIIFGIVSAIYIRNINAFSTGNNLKQGNGSALDKYSIANIDTGNDVMQNQSAIKGEESFEDKLLDDGKQQQIDIIVIDMACMVTLFC